MEALAPLRQQVVEDRVTSVVVAKRFLEKLIYSASWGRFGSIDRLLFFFGDFCGGVQGLEDIRSKDNGHVRWEDDPETTVQD